ncbi:MAG: serine hydrolase domain-containing protein, partial [Gemmatimonadaceae bacterium]
MHVPFATLILALSGPLCATACVPRQPPARTPGVADPEYAVAIERGRNIVRPLTRRGASVAVAVGVDGKLVWSEGFGREALEGGAPTRPDAPFRVYSLFKQITAAAAIQSAAIGEIDLRASIRRIMPSLPEHLDAVTMQQLLTHTAGIRHYRDSVEAHLTQHCTAAMQALPLFVQDPLVSEPGTRVSYSTWGFALASALLE